MKKMIKKAAVIGLAVASVFAVPAITSSANAGSATHWTVGAGAAG